MIRCHFLWYVQINSREFQLQRTTTTTTKKYSFILSVELIHQFNVMYVFACRWIYSCVIMGESCWRLNVNLKCVKSKIWKCKGVVYSNDDREIPILIWWNILSQCIHEILFTENTTSDKDSNRFAFIVCYDRFSQMMFMKLGYNFPQIRAPNVDSACATPIID